MLHSHVLDSHSLLVLRDPSRQGDVGTTVLDFAGGALDTFSGGLDALGDLGGTVLDFAGDALGGLSDGLGAIGNMGMNALDMGMDALQDLGPSTFCEHLIPTKTLR